MSRTTQQDRARELEMLQLEQSIERLDAMLVYRHTARELRDAYQAKTGLEEQLRYLQALN